MKTLYNFILLVFSFSVCYSQAALQNSGNVQIHQDGQVGFHIDLINNGTFNQNLGLVGFYSTEDYLAISGSQTPRFFDMEVDVINHLYLDVNTEVVNSVSYIAGDIITPRDTPGVAIDYLENSFYILEDDFKNTDGYASYNGDLEFTFPIGDDDKLRPLITTNTTTNTIVKAAYFDENPNSPSIFNTVFSTTNLEPIIHTVSRVEFWDFDGPDNSLVTLTWDAESEIENLTSGNLDKLRVVGWHIADEQWKDLGNTNITGNFTEGTINSFLFNPSEYEVISFGVLVSEDDLSIYNLVSPNNDDINDTFVIEGIEAFDNTLKIFNRWGTEVYEVENYKNDWAGVANTASVIQRHKKVPTGTYYYILELKTSGETFTGWVYIVH